MICVSQPLFDHDLLKNVPMQMALTFWMNERKYFYKVIYLVIKGLILNYTIKILCH